MITEDAEVAALCERWGYGAVMASAARQWARRDPLGALTVGPCRAVADADLEEVRQAAETLRAMLPPEWRGVAQERVRQIVSAAARVGSASRHPVTVRVTGRGPARAARYSKEELADGE